MAMDELDYRAATSQGIERTPQFTEDRFGFTGYQILDLYEKEQLAPKIPIGASVIANYYDAHAQDYCQALRIRGRFLEFKTADDALNWKAAMSSKEGSNSVGRAVPAGDQVVEVGLADPVRGFGLLHDLLFTCPEGTTIGPIQRGASFFCFLKEQNLLVGPKPLNMMAGKIREIMLRQALDSRELKVASDWSEKLRINIENLDFANQRQLYAQSSLR
jgi:hypothetical protein